MTFMLNDYQENMQAYVVILIVIEIMYRNLYKVYLKLN